MNILVTGSRGQLGSDATQVLAAGHNVKGMDLPELDITRPESFDSVIGGWPDVILNCAAFTNVDASESDDGQAWRVNAEGPGNLAEYAGAHGACLLQVSTDYVFNGRKPVPEAYGEDDPTEPLSVYGQSKLAGESAVRNSGCRFAIVRTSWLYGASGQNFLKTMLRLAVTDPQKMIRVVDDQYGCPTWSNRLAEQLRRIIETRTQGILHAVGEGHCTWYGLAAFFLETMDVRHQLVPCTTLEYPTPAKRPANSILRNSQLEAAGINVMRNWKTDVMEFVEAHRDQLMKEAIQSAEEARFGCR